jgi:F-type H+-transporting ATPase subunit gamma
MLRARLSMAELSAIKRRLRSVTGTRQITKAMQLVAASKLRRAEAAAKAPQAYLASLREVASRLGSLPEAARHPFYEQREVKRILAIVVAGDRGLAGAYNYNVFRELARLERRLGVETDIITIGRRGSIHLSRIDGLNELAAYEMDSHDPDTGLARPILTEAQDLFMSGKVDAVYLVGTHYETSSSQTAFARQILPISAPDNRVIAPVTEPDSSDVLGAVTLRLLEGEVYLAVVEARASEQAARMVAMMNASDNASDLIDDLTLARNNARQAAITQELAEISSGAEAVSSN